MTFGSLFSGIGGMDLGLERAGMTCKWQVEIDPFCQKVLAKHWPHVKRYGDIRTVELYIDEVGERTNTLDPIDLVAGGFPCQDISNAGNGVGIVGSRSGLWQEFARILAELRPKFAFVENVTALRTKGLTLVLQDLVALGFDAEWHCIPASALGANHERDRIWIFAYPTGLFREALIWGEPHRAIQAVREDTGIESDGWGSWRPGRLDTGYSWQREQPLQVPDPYRERCGDSRRCERSRAAEEAGPQCWPARPTVLRGETINPGANRARLEKQEYRDQAQFQASFRSVADSYCEPLVGAAIARGERHAWTSEPGVVRMVHGIPNRVDRLKGLGNAVVPQVAEWIGRRILEAAHA